MMGIEKTTRRINGKSYVDGKRESFQNFVEVFWVELLGSVDDFGATEMSVRIVMNELDRLSVADGVINHPLLLKEIESGHHDKRKDKNR